jgi:LPS export ABC transporter protein LptC
MRFLLCAVLAAVAAAGARAAPEEVRDASAALSRLDAQLRLTGMTYVGSRGASDEFVLRAERAAFRPETQRAELEQMEVVATDADAERSFDVRCARGELDVETNDFLAEGDVRGSTGDGRHYRADWVRYDHERALLYTDAPVVMRDDTGTFRGDGFRYYVKERRFRLLGNVSVVQEP